MEDPIVLKGLRSSDYEHAYDRQALNILEGTPGFEFLFKKFWEIGIERMLTVQCTGSNIEVTQKNFPELLSIFTSACEILDVPFVPRLYLELSPSVNAYATGVENPIIVLSSEIIDKMTNDELMFIIGHELGHVKSNHVLYQHMGKFVPFAGNIIGQATLGIGKILSVGLNAALQNWMRMAEFTADRAGLLASQNFKGSASAMVKLAGLPEKYYHVDVVDAFIEQSVKFESLDYENLNRVAKILAGMSSTHPWTVQRCAEMNRYFNEGEMDSLIASLKEIKMINISPEANNCPNCGHEIIASSKFCGGCGKEIVNVDFL